MYRSVTKSSPPPYDGPSLDRIALDYAGRYATTQAKLATYLRRKLRERGWAGEGAPPVEAIVARFAEHGYVNDGAFAEQRTESLLRRGYGQRRIAANLRAAGIDDAIAGALGERIADRAEESAWAFARRRRLGPFSTKAQNLAEKQRQIAAMIRAGHGGEIARRIIGASLPEEEVD